MLARRLAWASVTVLASVFSLQALIALKAAESDAREHADRGTQLLNQGDLAGAEAEMRKAVELAPGEPAYLSSLGAILGMEHRLDESSMFLKQALAIDPQDMAARRNLGSNQLQLGQLQPAKENWERVVQARPGDNVAVLLLGMVCEELHDHGRAESYCLGSGARARTGARSVLSTG